MDTVPRLPAIYFEKLLESSPDIVVAVDRQGTIIFYNDGARSTLGYSPEEVLGQHVTRLYPDLAEARKVMAAMREGSAPTRRDRCGTSRPCFVAKSGAHIPVAISGSIIHDRRRRGARARSASPRTCARSGGTIGWSRSARSPSASRTRSTTRSR